MAESAVSFLLGQLSTWITQERQLLGTLGETGDFIFEELGHLRAFLRVADEKQQVNPQLKEWVNQVRNLAYDAEDVMDEFMLRFNGRPMDGCLARIKQLCTSINNLKARRRLASEMRSIQSRVKRISEGQQRYRDIYGAASNIDHRSWYDIRGDALLLEETEVVGVEKPKKQLVRWLSSSSQIKVISVVGIGGLGKTTVVRKVYEDATVKARFTTRLWVTVSNSYELRDLLKSMIRKLVSQVKQPPPEGLDTMDTDEMKEVIYRFLQHKSYIVVLDDVWRLEDWEAIRYAFPRSTTCGCSIIITTRVHSIGDAASIENNGHVYNLEPLSQEDSKVLLCKKAFLGSSCPGYLEEMADFVLNKCQGLPLAIVVVGSLLATKRNDVEEWTKLCGSFSDELEGNHLSRITRLLSLSYYDLPYYLKSCLLYMSIFKEDKMVYVSGLVRLWISEGFVHPKMGKTMEEVAEEYVRELIDRSLFQVEEPPFYDRPHRVRVHDLLHAMLVSMSKEQSFVTIANSGHTTLWPNKIRRLVVHGSSATHSWPDMGDCRHLRSLLFFQCINLPPNLSLSNLLRTTRLLKVLELRGSVSESIPDEVYRLYHLKFLSVKGTHVKTISRSIGNLEKLETLNLKNTRVTELPVEILRLRRLQHLLVYHYRNERGFHPFNNVHSFKAPHRIGCLSSLQSLVDIDATPACDTTIVREIGKLKMLKELGIMKLREEDGKDLCISLKKLTRLETLYIASVDENEMLDLMDDVSPAPPIRLLELRGRLLKIPQWITSLHSLSKLALKWSRMNDDPLECVQYLPNLMYLQLCHAYQGTSLCFKARGFQRLKKLLIMNLDGLESLRVEQGSMPILQQLYIWGCKAMDEVPLGIEHLRDLQYVDFSNMSQGFERALEKQKEEEADNWKLAHIPKVEIYSSTQAGQWQARSL